MPRMTLEEKLKAAQSDAEESRTRITTSLTNGQGSSDLDLDLELENASEVLKSPAKKTRMKGVAKRRKSTLNPEELERLLAMGDD